MNVESLREYCLQKPCVEECFPFDDVSLVMKVGGKMFAFIPLESADSVTLKCAEERAVELKERYEGVTAAWHFNKRYWITARFGSDVPDGLILELVDGSYSEVVGKLARKLRKELGLEV